MNKKASIKAHRFLFSLLLFITPLLIVTNTNELYEFPKMFFVYFIGSTILLLFLLKLLTQKENPTLNRIPVVMLLFVVANVFSAAFSSHVYTSIWGYYTRFNGGLISLIIFFGLYIVLINIKKHFNIEELMLFPFITLIPICLYALQQHYFLGIPRVYSTLGNPNWLAVYIIMLIPAVLYALLTAHSKKHKYFFSALFLLSYAALWFTYSLSGMLGFLVAMAIFAIFNKQLILSKKKLVSVIFTGIFLFSLVQPGIYKNRVKDVFLDLKKAYAQETTATTNSQVSDPGFIRLNVWKGTLKLAVSSSKNFFIGTGPETFPYQFPKHRPQELNYSSEWDFILNKPHNYYLEILSETGIFALTSFFGIIVYSIKKRHKYITPALVGYYITLVFGFPVVPVLTLFWFYLGILYEN